MNHENFIFYGSFRKTIDALPEELGNKILRAIMNYGTSYEAPEEIEDDADSATVYAIMQLIIPNIEKQKTNYENASRGGRPVKFSQEDFNTLLDKGLSNVDIAKKLNCSDKTVERRKRIWRAKDKDKDIDIDIDTVGYDGYDGIDNPTENPIDESAIANSTINKEWALITRDKLTENQTHYYNAVSIICNRYKGTEQSIILDELAKLLAEGYYIFYIDYCTNRIKTSEGLVDYRGIRRLRQFCAFQNIQDDYDKKGKKTAKAKAVNLHDLLTVEQPQRLAQERADQLKRAEELKRKRIEDEKKEKRYFDILAEQKKAKTL